MSRKESAALFILIAMVLFNVPALVPALEGMRASLSHRTFHLLMALVYFMPGVGVIFVVLGIYRLATNDKPKEEMK